MFRLLLAAALLFALPAHSVSIEWVTVDDPSNPADTEVMNDGTTGYGSVPHTYRISKYEVTNAQYVEFLNAVAGTDTQTSCASPGATANTANCGSPPGYLTDVGSYTGSASPNGTFDQGGNLEEWNEAIIGSNRGARGAAFGRAHPFLGPYLAAWSRNSIDPTHESVKVGFRVAMIPEPSTALLIAVGLAGLTAAGRRRSHHEKTTPPGKLEVQARHG